MGYKNQIELKGILCKQPNLRQTPKGIDICDAFLAINRARSSDYIPLIVWHRSATYFSKHKIGDKIQVIGRIQSRKYTNQKNETKTAYEVSVVSYSAEEDKNE